MLNRLQPTLRVVTTSLFLLSMSGCEQDIDNTDDTAGLLAVDEDPLTEIDSSIESNDQFKFVSDDGRLFVEQRGDSLTGWYYEPTDDQRIYFETQRGAPTEIDGHPTDPMAPEFETSVRFLDEHGDTFILVGGTSESDQGAPSWLEEMRQADADPTELDARPTQFMSARAAAQIFQDVAVPDDFVWEQQAIVDAGLLVSDEFLHADTIPDERDVGDENHAATAGSGTNEITSAPLAAGGAWSHYAQIRYKDAFWDNNIVDHSAVLLYTYYNNSLNAWWTTSNHGTSASSGSMNTKCGTLWTGRSSQWPPFRDNACTTPYGVHVCNNDTYLEYEMVRSQSNLSGANWRCFGLMGLAPSCY